MRAAPAEAFYAIVGHRISPSYSIEKLMWLKANEPDTLTMGCYFADESNAVIVHDVFKDGAALGTHLGGTAAHHFPKLFDIAVPGPFFFCGDVPDELRRAAEGMNMGAIFGARASWDWSCSSWRH